VAIQHARTAGVRTISRKSARRVLSPAGLGPGAGAADAQGREEDAGARDAGGNAEGERESPRGHRPAEPRAQRHSKVEGGGVPPVRPAQEMRRDAVPHVGHHGGEKHASPIPAKR